MWHDRRPGPAPISSRTNSPVPRRLSNLTPGPGPLPPRPGVLPRTSSLSAASSPGASTASLATTLRNINGSALRNEFRSEPAADAPDPLSVLNRIVGAAAHAAPENGQRPDHVPDDIDRDIDFGSLSLEEFIAENSVRAKHSSVLGPPLSREEYDRERSRFEELHRSIAACDQVLNFVETFLTGFQADLGAVSAEIESLQSRSSSLNSKLDKRRVVEKLLGPAVEDLSISPDVVKRIADGPIDDAWIRALAEFDRKSKAIKAKTEEHQNVKAMQDLLPLVENLTNKAVERIRDYFVAQIRALRSPNINAQILQQQNFLRCKDLYTFLANAQPELASGICQAYVNTMRWYYLSQFTRYETALKQVKLHTVDKNDLLGSDDAGARKPGRRPVAHDPFTIGRRFDILKSQSTQAITSYAAEENKAPQHIEVVFRAFNIALVDNASFEYTFLSGFLGGACAPAAVTRAFDTVFAPTFKLGQELTRSLAVADAASTGAIGSIGSNIGGTIGVGGGAAGGGGDALGVLLCIRLTQRLAFALQRRRVPPAEAYTNATAMLLWPRFQILVDRHAESLRRRSPAGGGGGSSADAPSSSAAAAAAPLPVSQRFASFVHAVLLLSAEAPDDEPLANGLARLRGEYEALVGRVAAGIADARRRERFLFNNYSLVGTILEGAPGGKLAEENREYFKRLREKHGEGYG